MTGPVAIYPIVLIMYFITLFNDDLTRDGSGASQISFNEAYIALILYLFLMGISSLYQYEYLPKLKEYTRLITGGEIE